MPVTRAMATPDRRWPVMALVAALTPDSRAFPLDELVAVDSVAGPSLQAVSNAAERPTPTHHSQHSGRRVPPQYSPGSDGLWRRLDSFTLVGSTVCESGGLCPPTASSTQAPSEDDILDTVPSGWVSEKISNPVRTGITVSLSLILAFLIVIALGHSHLTRGPRFKRKNTDVEKRKSSRSLRGQISAAESSMLVHQRSRSSETLASLADEGAKSSATRWTARATKRWRDNVRYLARQRRGRPRHLNHPAFSTDSRRPSPSVSSASSPRTSVETFVDITSSEQPTPPSPVSVLSSSSSSLRSISPLPRRTSVGPPAYLSSTSRLPLRSQEPSSSLSQASSSMNRDLGLRLEIDADPGEEVFPPYSLSAEERPPEAAIAHVATDDKTVLARLQEEASSPDTHSPHRELLVLEEDELPLPDLEHCPPWPSPSPESDLGLPAPPLALDWTNAREEKLAMERAFATMDDVIPCATRPRFSTYGIQQEAGPSSRPISFPTPSAPPLEDDDQLPSAPLFEDDDGDSEWQEGSDSGSSALATLPSASDESPDRDGDFPRSSLSVLNREKRDHAPAGSGEAHDTGWDVEAQQVI